ncbi:MAG TPA: sugar ABC transporter substrate-binding protein [Conexibacter sp.]|nr:sugar ABC transporter substrate-binding protein [Conexibacter sp.]
MQFISRRGLALACACLVALGVAACGSSDESSSGSTAGGTATSGQQADVASVEAAVERAKEPVSDRTLGPPVAATRGKKVTAIMCTAQSEGCALLGRRFKAAADTLGWDATIVDGGGAPDRQSAAVLNAVAAGTDGIFLISIDRSAVAQGLAKASAARIPVVSTASDNTAGDGPENVFAEVGFDGRALGEMAANWIVADSDAKANVAVFKSPELKALTDRWAGAEPIFEACADCKVVDTVEYSLARAVNDLPLRAKSLLLAHPDVDYIWLDAGGFTAPVANALQEIGRNDVKIATFDCVSSNFTAIRADEVVRACAGLGIPKAAWSGADQLNRAFAGEPAATVGDVGDIRLFDRTNLPDTAYWDGDFDYESNYKDNWGL